MNINVDVRVTLDLSGPLTELLRSVLAAMPQARVDDLDERIEAAVGRAVQLAGWERDAPLNTSIQPEPSSQPARKTRS